MNTIKTAAAAVLGARHARIARNGQDATAVWACGGDGRGGSDGAAGALELRDRRCVDGAMRRANVVVVSDGCSSGASSEVGARLGAQLFARAIGVRLAAGELVTEQQTWESARGDVVRILGELVDRLAPGPGAFGAARTAAIHDHFLFTLVAAAVCGDDAAVWALGDGAYSFGTTTHVIGPFADNQPPYLGYDLLDEPRPAYFVVAPACDVIAIATDGATELPDGLVPLMAARFVEHPDALRRQLAILARPTDRIDWTARRVERTPAALQDDCAVAVVRRTRPRRFE